MVIPVRYGSTRLPGKPLKLIAGKPMFQWVWQQSIASKAGRVVIATDDVRIEQAAAKFDAEVVMTRSDHLSGTDRLAEVARTLNFADDEVIVNVQGDEPLIPPALISQVAQLLADNPTAQMATLSEPVTDPVQLSDPNLVQVVTDRLGKALYFSRANIPSPRSGPVESEQLIKSSLWQRHIGIYAYRAQFLQEFVSWPPAELEQIEALEQLRALWNGATVMVAQACEPSPIGVDTQADLDQVRALAE
ncbi:MAG: 3-deoxy-manno-octulosonate cytidylyltransferase [Immundisolibacteraceae bacterium]|nr:3-deoxy-manno-octulosonate cytidylyltransferase [Immundisolibacteraceae bacterium]